MGWWRIVDGSGQMALGAPFSAGVIGDSPADTMGKALEEVVKCYEEERGRKPTLSELHAVLEFSSGHLELDPGFDGWYRVKRIRPPAGMEILVYNPVEGYLVYQPYDHEYIAEEKYAFWRPIPELRERRL